MNEDEPIPDTLREAVDIDQYLTETKAIAEKALEELERTENRDPEANHHIRNVVGGLRGVDCELDSPQEIQRICDEALTRIKPFIKIII